MALILALLESGSVFVATLWLGGPAWPRGFGEALTLSVVALVAYYFSDLYDLRVVPSVVAVAARLPRGVGLSLLSLIALSLLVPLSGTRVLGSVVLLAGLPVLIRAIVYRVLGSPLCTRRVLLIGASPLARQLIGEIEARPLCRIAVVGIMDDPAAAAGWAPPYPFFGPLAQLDKVIEEVRPHRIIVALADRRGRLPLGHLLEARQRGIVVEHGAEVYERLTGKLALESLSPSGLIFSENFRKSRLALGIQRAGSLLAAVIGLIGFAPFFSLIALAITLDSRGPVLFVQDRVGRGGKPFRLFKFRTMHPVNGKTSEWVRDNGHRITRVGKWLRRFRLDELPQLVNIIRGEMNLVGPRPHPLSNFELFTLLHRNLSEISGQAIPYYTLRSAVRPGITGWAQVRYGYANDPDEETEKLRYDLYYIKHMSLWCDLRILLDTIKIVFLDRRPAAAAEPWWATSENRQRPPLPRESTWITRAH